MCNGLKLLQTRQPLAEPYSDKRSKHLFFLKFYGYGTISTGRSKFNTILLCYNLSGGIVLDYFLNISISIPIIQLILLMLISTISLLFGKLKLALIVNYLFTLHWAYIANRDKLMDISSDNFEMFSLIYFIFGLGIVMTASFAFMFQKSD